MDILSKIFGSSARNKTIRLFIFNPELSFTTKEVRLKTKVPIEACRRELNLLSSVGMIKSRKNAKRGKIWELNKNFALINDFRSLLSRDFLERRKELVKKFKNCGQIKLLVISGVFVEDSDSRIDLCLVGNKLKRGVIDNIIKTIEAEVGRELTYAVLDKEDFLYRVNTSDKFIRDIFDYPHRLIIDKLVF